MNEYITIEHATTKIFPAGNDSRRYFSLSLGRNGKNASLFWEKWECPLEMYCCEETRWSPGKQALWKVDDSVKEFTTEMISDIEEDESD